MDMKWGCHKGKSVHELPIDYLKWLYYESILAAHDSELLEEVSDTLSERDPEWPF